MYRPTAKVIAVILTALVLSTAHAHHDSRHEAMKAKMDEVMHWLAENTEYDYVTPPPFIFVPKTTIDYAVAEVELGGYTGQAMQTVALYVNHLIIFNDKVEPTDGYVLAHELVHHLQLVNKKEFDCMGAREREAYEVQIKYVDEFGGLKPNDFFMLFLTCEGGPR